MFKVLKYLLLANLYKRAKKSFIYLFSSIVAFVVINFIMNDVISVSNGATVYILLMTKWLILLTLLGLIGFSILKIFNIATTPFSESKNKSKTIETTAALESKKKRILAKEKLYTKSDLILQKYMKD